MEPLHTKATRTNLGSTLNNGPSAPSSDCLTVTFKRFKYLHAMSYSIEHLSIRPPELPPRRV
jgi:hypothetical protein